MISAQCKESGQMNARLGTGSLDRTYKLQRVETRLRSYHKFFALMIALLGVSVVARAQSIAPQFVYTADESTHMISAFQLNATTGALTAVVGSPFDERLDPFAMAVDPAGKFLFVANHSTSDVSVFLINATTGALTEAQNSPFSSGKGIKPNVLTTDPGGKFLYVANTLDSNITSQGEVDTYAINPVTGVLTPSTAQPNGIVQIPVNPIGLIVHPSGKWIYVSGGSYAPTDSLIQVVQGYTLDPTSGILESSNSTFTGSEQAWSLAGDRNGNFLFAGHGQNCAFIDTLQISQADGSLQLGSTWDNGGSLVCAIFPMFTTVDSTNKFLFSNLGSLFIDSTSGVLTSDQINTPATVPQGPWSADPIGPFVFAGDSSGSLLHAYSINPSTGVLTEVGGSPYTTTAMAAAIVVTGQSTQTPAPAASFSPAGLSFSAVLGTALAPQTIQLFNTGTATLNISGISITGANSSDFTQVNTCGSTLVAGANCTLTVTYSPAAAGQSVATISVSDDAPGNPQSASLMGTAATPAPTAVLNPASLSFPQTNVGGSSATQTFVLSNKGNAPLTISSVTLAGPNPGDFSQTNSCGTSLNAGAQCAVTVTFQPQAVGSRTATVIVADNAAGSPQSGSLSGTAINPFIVAPSGPTTATVQPGQPANYMMSFTPMASFAGMVAFSCAVVPTGPSCTVSPMMVQVTASNNPVATPVSVTATSPASAGLLPAARSVNGAKLFGMRGLASNLILPVVFLGFVLSVWFVISTGRSLNAGLRSPQFSGVALVLAIAALCVAASCGGSHTTQPQPTNYSVKVTAAAGAATQTVTFSLTVQ